MLASCGDVAERERPAESSPVRKIAGEEVSVYINNALYRRFSIDFLSDLPETSFKTGLSDVQKGVLLYLVLQKMGIYEAQKVILKGIGSPPVEILWKDLIDENKKILISITHRGTFKVISGNPELIRRKNWQRHLRRIDVIIKQGK